jgi:8-oxo-dGTP pyrophosphatase MutT (NUDIX family)
MLTSKPSEEIPYTDLGSVRLTTESYVFYAGQVLMHRRSKLKQYFPSSLLGVGGRVNATEDVMTGAIREIKEEAGIVVAPGLMKLRAVALHHHPLLRKAWIVFIYRATLTKDPGSLTDSEEGTSFWAPVGQISEGGELVAPSAYYFSHVASADPGVMYTNIEWRDTQLSRLISQTLV